MSETIIGFARWSTDERDRTAQRQRLAERGVAAERVSLDHGLTGTTRARPSLDQALAAVDLAELFSIGRATVYRTLQRNGGR